MEDITSHDQNQDVKSGPVTSSQIPALQKKLESLLPYSIPLVERIKFHLAHPVSETSRIFVAVYNPAAKDTAAPSPGGPRPSTHRHTVGVSDTWLQDTTTSAAAPPPWLAAHIDLVHYGQTQVWVFASWEHPSQQRQQQHTYTPAPTQAQTDAHTHVERENTTTTTGGGGEYDPIHEALVTSLFKYIYTSLIPTMPTTPSGEWLTLLRTGKTLTTPYSRTKILFGTVSDKLWRYLPDHVRARMDPGYLKYVFTPDNPITATESAATAATPFRLPQGYTFTTLLPTHLQTVLDRSSIPRTLSTLSQYVNVGVLHMSSGPDPVAWGFLGKDASVSSLHTEPDHRGLGLAACVTRELIRRQHQRQASDLNHEDEEDTTGRRWAHADVSQSNLSSRRVMEKLGAKPMWRVMWTELDLEKFFYPSPS
ncbi:hypothetical protein PV08_07567 [Exophiala spinifera]|uniref:N-acetyltransferase domain-containing protein n=1 Tax=Exophiala spinifera TaxID=91928 RepID=A0A0D1ZPN5_9EURO|nr:uncharacterized protein PV08_07567 [Exophiala spinifera]KIW14782.1 hypothetical protein PV08_07567 [Exophiala spinifera]